MTLFRLVLCFVLTLTFAAPAFSTHKFIRDNKLTKREAVSLMDKASRNTEFPLIINDDVLKQLNRLIGTPGKRKHMRQCLKRMEKYRPIISKLIAKHDLPQELLAIPLIESGYENIHSKHGWGSGIWMFIKMTAKSYGLRVNKKNDQRLNVSLSTVAALKYIKANKKILKDWGLTILAYNLGENAVLKGIKKTGSKNAWTLVHKGHERDKGYLAKIIAAAIIIKNPEILK